MTRRYSVKVLKKMIEIYTSNIESHTKSNQYARGEERVLEQVANLIAKRRYIAAMVENDGVYLEPPEFANGGVFFDSMLYSACAGADTSWWAGN